MMEFTGASLCGSEGWLMCDVVVSEVRINLVTSSDPFLSIHWLNILLAIFLFSLIHF